MAASVVHPAIGTSLVRAGRVDDLVMVANPWPLRWYRDDADGDGRLHGFDGVVAAESPFLGRAALSIYPRSHGRLLPGPDVVSLIVRTLATTP